MMNPLKLRFLTEQYEKENRHLRLQKEFVLTTQTTALMGKFYAKHDALSKSDVQEEFLKHIERRTVAMPKDVYSFKPPSVNMEYGWFSEPLIPKTNDPRLYFAKKHCDFVENELKIRKLHKGALTEKFSGVPFKV